MRLMMKLTASILMLTAAAPAVAQPWVARHDLNSSSYQAEFNKWTAKGYRPTDVSGYSKAGQPRFAVLFEKVTGPAWVARHNLTSSGYQSQFNHWTSRGYRLVDVSGYESSGQTRFAAIWERKSGPAWAARHNMTSNGYQTAFNDYARRGYRLAHVSGYSVNGSPRFAAIWEKRSGPAYIARHNLTSSAYQDAFELYTLWGYRLTQVSGYQSNGSQRYAAIWERSSGPAYIARHALSSSNYQAEMDNQVGTGHRPTAVSGFAVGGDTRFAAIWEGGALRPVDQEQVNDRITRFMDQNDVPGLSIALSRNGRLVYARGYGRADQEEGQLMSPRHRLRIASITKPITAIATMRLLEDGLLNDLDQRVFGRRSILGEDFGDEFLSGYTDITVRHLLEHTSGLPGNSSNDPMFQFLDLNQQDLIERVLETRQLSATPGAAYDYSNFAYCVLGRVIEKLSGRSYESYVRQQIANPSRASTLVIGGDTLDARLPWEVRYYGNAPYSYLMRRMDAHGGFISTPTDLLRVAERVDGLPNPGDILDGMSVEDMLEASARRTSQGLGWRRDNSGDYWHGGRLRNSTRSELRCRSDQICYAIITNQDVSGLSDLAVDVINLIDAWPSGSAL